MSSPSHSVQRQRWRLLVQLTSAAELPMAVLSAAWLLLLVLELAIGLPPALQAVNYFIWGLFVLQFVLEFTIAPDKLPYLRRNWMTALALVLPAFRLLRFLRILRILRVAAAARSLSLIRILLSLNRGISVLRRVMTRRGLGYVMALTLLVYFLGAGGMLAFEGLSSEAASGRGFAGYGHALWWTAMIITTMGTDYWPQTGEGRLLCILLAIYGYSVFGYITAVLATYFIGADRKREIQPSASELRALLAEIASIRQALTVDAQGNRPRAEGA